MTNDLKETIALLIAFSFSVARIIREIRGWHIENKKLEIKKSKLKGK